MPGMPPIVIVSARGERIGRLDVVAVTVTFGVGVLPVHEAVCVKFVIASERPSVGGDRSGRRAAGRRGDRIAERMFLAESGTAIVTVVVSAAEQDRRVA